MEQNTTAVLNALKLIGKNEELRNKFIQFCIEVENKLDYQGSVRDNLTKDLVDVVCSEVPLMRKSIKNGLQFDFFPNIGSKVAREFIMSTPAVPTYVWEPQTTKLLLHLAEKAKNVAIGGAYFGDQTILIAEKIKKNSGTCHAFELNEKQAAILSGNAAINNLDNVKVINLGLWNDSKTFLNLSETDDLATASPAESSDKSNTITIDDYVKTNNIKNIDLIMLDIEGSEFNVLLGSENELSRPAGEAPNLVFEVHRSYVDWSNGLENTEIIQFLYSFGYTVYSVRDFQGNYDMTEKPIELIPVNTTYLEGPPHGFNMLAIKDTSIIENEQFTIVDNVSPKYLLHKDPKIHSHLAGFNTNQ